MKNFFELLKATRIHRTVTALTAVMVPVAFADRITINILYLLLVCIFIYGAGSIINAKKDRDFKIPRHYKLFSVILLSIAFIFALQHPVLLFTFIAWILLGVFYNTISRYILCGDVTVLAITHLGLTTFSSSLLLGLDIRLTISLTLFIFTTSWFIIHLKNLKDIDDDSQRKYKTLPISVKNGIPKTKLMFEISFLCMFIAYFIFGLSKIYLYALAGILVIKIIVNYLVDLKKHEAALNIMRMMVIGFSLAMILDRATNQFIILISLILGASYLFFLEIEILGRRAGINIPV